MSEAHHYIATHWLCQLNSSYGENHLISFTFNSQSINKFDLSPFVSANPFVCWYRVALSLCVRVFSLSTQLMLFCSYSIAYSAQRSQQYLLRKHFPYNYPSSVTAFRFMLHAASAPVSSAAAVAAATITTWTKTSKTNGEEINEFPLLPIPEMERTSMPAIQKGVFHCVEHFSY